MAKKTEKSFCSVIRSAHLQITILGSNSIIVWTISEMFLSMKKRIFEIQNMKMSINKSFPVLITISNIISNVLNPLFSLLIFLAVYSYEKSDGKFNLTSFLLPIALVVIPIFGWIYWNVKKGNYTNMDVSNREQRNSLYLFNFFIISIYNFGNISL